MKVKSIDKIEKYYSGSTIGYQATVTWDDTSTSVVQGPACNPVDYKTQLALDEALSANLKAAITNAATAKDTILSDATKLDTVKTTILSDLSKAGLTVALALMLCILPVLSQAGTLQPEWGDSTAVVMDPSSSVSGQAIPGQRRPTSMGTIDSSAYYVTHVWINAWEAGGSTGSLGVSVYAVDTSSGVSTANLPMTVVEISNTEATIADGSTAGSGQMHASTGITKYLGAYEGVPALNIAVGANNASDTWYTKIKYKRMRGQY